MPFEAPSMGDAFGDVFANDIFSAEGKGLEISDMAAPIAPVQPNFGGADLDLDMDSSFAVDAHQAAPFAAPTANDMFDAPVQFEAPIAPQRPSFEAQKSAPEPPV